MDELKNHKLNISFNEQMPGASKSEVEMFNEAFAHYHKVMTEYNGQYIRNAIYLNENFIPLWNELQDPKLLFETLMEHVISQGRATNDREI